MTFEELIERLKKYDLEQLDKCGEMTGEFSVVKMRYSAYCKSQLLDDYMYLYGLVSGLCAVGFVTETEKDQLVDILIVNKE